MARQNINLGTDPDGIGGDTERAAFVKCNANFTELYNGVAASVVESGSNAQGSYTRWADGTQICWVKFTGYTAGQKEGAWAMPFREAPVVSGSVQPSAALDYQWMVWGSAASWGFWPAVSNNNIVSIMGIGRWK